MAPPGLGLCPLGGFFVAFALLIAVIAASCSAAMADLSLFCGETDFSDRFIKEEEEGTQGRRPWEEFRDDSDKRMAGKVHRVANFMVNYELILCIQQFVQTSLMFRSSWPTRKESFFIADCKFNTS